MDQIWSKTFGKSGLDITDTDRNYEEKLLDDSEDDEADDDDLLPKAFMESSEQFDEYQLPSHERCDGDIK